MIRGFTDFGKHENDVRYTGSRDPTFIGLDCQGRRIIIFFIIIYKKYVFCGWLGCPCGLMPKPCLDGHPLVNIETTSILLHCMYVITITESYTLKHKCKFDFFFIL